MNWFTKLWSRDCSIHPENFTDAQWEELIAYTHENPDFPYALYRMSKTPRRSGFKLTFNQTLWYDVDEKCINLNPNAPVEWHDTYEPWKTE